MNKIKELIQSGELRHYIQRNNRGGRGGHGGRGGRGRGGYRERDERPRIEEPREEQQHERGFGNEGNQKRVINTIVGGFAGGGITHLARKKHLRVVRSINAVGGGSSFRRTPPITFTYQDFKGIDPVHDDPMVVSVEMRNCIVKKVLVDQGSSVEILYWKTFKELGIDESEIKPYRDELVGFSGERVETKGYINLFTKFRDDADSVTIEVRYIVVKANTSYNILLGRPALNALGAIMSTPHLAMKFPSNHNTIITVHADQKTARECYLASLKVTPFKEEVNLITVGRDEASEEIPSLVELDR